MVDEIGWYQVELFHDTYHNIGCVTWHNNVATLIGWLNNNVVVFLQVFKSLLLVTGQIAGQIMRSGKLRDFGLNLFETIGNIGGEVTEVSVGLIVGSGCEPGTSPVAPSSYRSITLRSARNSSMVKCLVRSVSLRSKLTFWRFLSNINLKVRLRAKRYRSLIVSVICIGSRGQKPRPSCKTDNSSEDNGLDDKLMTFKFDEWRCWVEAWEEVCEWMCLYWFVVVSLDPVRLNLKNQYQWEGEGSPGVCADWCLEEVFLPFLGAAREVPPL